eukprot:TRINITY_DN26284_c0_g1_i1.p2 TRINITY_DN26284_c0_g1~~TRINITY_DN26284_c0_g1_i1.p2  ORF type:complete len:240 (+),score=81.11 TRINITY_DN26284_c0_g1_i1:42-761(+)
MRWLLPTRVLLCWLRAGATGPVSRKVDKSFGGLPRATRAVEGQAGWENLRLAAGLDDAAVERLRARGDAGCAAIIAGLYNAAVGLRSNYLQAGAAQWHIMTELGALRDSGCVLGPLTLSAMLRGAAKLKGCARASKLYQGWLDDGLPDCPEAPLILLRGWSRNSSRQAQAWRDAVERGHEPTAEWYEALLTSCSDEEAAASVVAKMRSCGFALSRVGSVRYVRSAGDSAAALLPVGWRR